MGCLKTMLAPAAWLAMTACQPTIGDAPGIGGDTQPDSGIPGDGEQEPGEPDGEPSEPPPDSGPGSAEDVLLTQTTSDQIRDGHSRGCVEQDDNDDPVQNRENSYYRVFDLGEQDFEGDLEVSSVVFGVESASAPDNGAQPATVRLHTLEGDLLVANMEEIAVKQIDIASQDQTTLEVPLDEPVRVPAGSTLVFELFIENSTENRLFFLGSNDLGQIEPGYLRAPSSGCDLREPTDFAAFGFPNIHIVMMVSGSALPSDASVTRSGTPAPAAPRRVLVW